MAYPVYVLLHDDVEWTAVPGTVAQKPAPVRWYLRQSMPTATCQVAVLVDDADDATMDRMIAEVARTAEALGGVAVDGHTQDRIDPAHASAVH